MLSSFARNASFLGRLITRSKHSLTEQSNPSLTGFWLHVIRRCTFRCREHRLGIDLVCDSVEKELLKECQVIKGAENLLVRTLEQTQEQIRRLKATLYYMDHDLEDKENNLRIDKHNLTLKETSLNLSIYHGTSRLNPSYVFHWTCILILFQKHGDFTVNFLTT